MWLKYQHYSLLLIILSNFMLFIKIYLRKNFKSFKVFILKIIRKNEKSVFKFFFLFL